MQAPSILLMGGPGSGKSYSLTTCIEAGKELFAIITEPNGLDTMLDAIDRKGLDINKFHYVMVSPAAPGWDTMTDMASKIGKLDFASLSGIKGGIGKKDTQQFMKVITSLHNFVDDRTGEEYGDVSLFSSDKVLAIDSLSGLNVMAMDMVTGYKPTASQGEWGVAMNALDRLLLKLTSELQCMLIVTAHLDREVDEVAGGVKLMASALGRKLAPKLPRFFSEVVMAYRDDNHFYWSTADSKADLKSRALPIASKIEPDFRQIFEVHERRLKTLQPAT